MLVVAMLVATGATAHLPGRPGRLIDLVERSDLVVVGTATSVHAVDAQWAETTVQVDATIIGAPAAATIEFRAHPRVAPGQRFVFFLRRRGAALECLQPSGTVFASRRQDDPAYRETITAVRGALASGPVERTTALRTVMISALSAPAAPLRYHAMLELGALAQDGLRAPERRTLELLLADPSTDPALRPAMTSLVHAAPPALAGASRADDAPR